MVNENNNDVDLNYQIFLTTKVFSNDLVLKKYLYFQYSYNSQTKIEKQFLYNQDGQLIRRITTDCKNDSIHFVDNENNGDENTHVFVYGDSNMLIKEIDIDSKGDEILIIEYEYDSAGNQTLRKFRCDNVCKIVQSLYDEQGRIKEIIYSSDGIVTSISTFEYFLNLEIETNLNCNRNQVQRWERSFDNMNNLLIVKEYNRNKNLVSLTNYEYNKENRLVKVVILDNQGRVLKSTEHTYDERNVLVKTIEFDIRTCVNQITDYEYDNQKRDIRKKVSIYKDTMLTEENIYEFNYI